MLISSLYFCTALPIRGTPNIFAIALLRLQLSPTIYTTFEIVELNISNVDEIKST